MLTANQVAVIKQTVPVLQENGEVLTRHFYERGSVDVLQPGPLESGYSAAGVGRGYLCLCSAY